MKARRSKAMLKKLTKSRIKIRKNFSIPTASLLVAVFAFVGGYIIINSFAATNTICPNLAAGDCRPYDDQSPFNQPIPAYDPATGLSTDGKNTMVWDKTKSTDYSNQLTAIGMPLTSNFDANTQGCTPGVYEVNDQSTVSPNDVYDQQKYTNKTNHLVENSNVKVTGYSYSRIMIYDKPFAINDGGGVESPNKTALVPVTANVMADDCDGQTVFWNPMTGDEWGFWFFDASSKTGAAIPYTYTAANGHKTKTTAGFMGRFGDGGGRGAGTTYFSGLVRKWEIKQKKIEHALSFAFGSPASSYVYPAGKSDGDGGTTIPEGTRFQLDPTLTDSDLAGLGCTKACLTIAHALQQYGMYTIDNSGSSKIYLEAQSSAHWDDSDNDNVTDTKDADLAQVASLAKNLPKSLTPSNSWNKFRVVAPPCIATSTSNCPTTQNSTSTPPPPPPPADTTPPTAPTTFTATASAYNNVNLSWSGASDNIGVTSYDIYRGTGTATPTLLKNVTTTSTTDATVSASTTYSYYIKAKDAANNTSPASATKTVTTPAVPATTDSTAPSVPSSLASSVTTSQVNLAWSPSSDNVGVVKYRVYLNGGTTPLYEPTTNTYAHTGLTAATAYSYQVSAVDAAGNESARSASYTATTSPASDTTAPTVDMTAPPSNATVKGTYTITADASDSSGIARLEFYIDNVLLSSDTSSPYSVNWNTTVETQGNHVIKIVAYDNASPANSAIAYRSVNVDNSDTTPPTAPVLTGKALSDTQVSLSWTASTDNVGVAGYRVVRTDGKTVQLSSSTLTYTDSSLAAGTTYGYTVVAYDAANNTASSNNVNLTTLTPPPADTTVATPTGLSATLISESQVNLSWNPVTDPSGIKGYNVYRNGTKVASLVTTTSWGEANLTAGTTYSYTVTAVDGANNESTKSTAASVTTPLPPPPTTITYITLTPTDDAYVNSSSPNYNSGKNSSLQIVGGSGAKYSLLKFNVSGVGTKKVLSAKLKLYVTNDTDKGGNFHKITNNNWSQSTVTWNTKPSFDAANLASLGATKVSTRVEADLTNLISGDGTYGVLINSTSANATAYSSKEATNKPQLILGVQ